MTKYERDLDGRKAQYESEDFAEAARLQRDAARYAARAFPAHLADARDDSFEARAEAFDAALRAGAPVVDTPRPSAQLVARLEAAARVVSQITPAVTSFYAGDRYFANAADAAFWQKVERERAELRQRATGAV